MSAPSDTSTTPATGRPASSSRTPSKAAPSLVCEPLKVSSLADCTREAADEKRKTRTRKRSPSDFSSGAVGGAELVLHELAARLPGHIGNLHAARVVEQHGHDVLLVDGGAHDERRAEEAEEDERQRRQAQRGQDDAIPRTALGDLDAAVGEDGERRRDGRQTGGEERRPGEVEAELALLEDDRAIGKERLKQGVKHWRRSPNP